MRTTIGILTTTFATVPGVVDVHNEIAVGDPGVRDEHGPGPVPEQISGAR